MLHLMNTILLSSYDVEKFIENANLVGPRRQLGQITEIFEAIPDPVLSGTASRARLAGRNPCRTHVPLNILRRHGAGYH